MAQRLSLAARRADRHEVSSSAKGVGGPNHGSTPESAYVLPYSLPHLRPQKVCLAQHAIATTYSDSCPLYCNQHSPNTLAPHV